LTVGLVDLADLIPKLVRVHGGTWVVPAAVCAIRAFEIVCQLVAQVRGDDHVEEGEASALVTDEAAARSPSDLVGSAAVEIGEGFEERDPNLSVRFADNLEVKNAAAVVEEPE
jgi:hypothetical protein